MVMFIKDILLYLATKNNFCYTFPNLEMSSKSLVMLGMIVGSTVGGFVPTLFGVDFLSF